MEIDFEVPLARVSAHSARFLAPFVHDDFHEFMVNGMKTIRESNIAFAAKTAPAPAPSRGSKSGLVGCHPGPVRLASGLLGVGLVDAGVELLGVGSVLAELLGVGPAGPWASGR
jgi:hypothetical protein